MIKMTRSRDNARHKLLLKRYEQGIARFTELLQIGVERGEFSPMMDIEDISKLAASFQEGIMTHSISVGLEKPNTKMPFQALIEYLKSLLQPVLVKKAVPEEELQ
ncbi:hypothetical protein [Marinicrinis lubricantis]|uniref:YfiR C-terminal domain-containing protein n=1 Tax=Marinicrinis lubricantis TaxID=2086470 RepID=A0ABW1IVJ2_9BACL